MISVLIEGKLHADPVRRITAKGREYITGQMRAADDAGATTWCNLIAFDAGAVESLGKLAGGDAVAVVGFASVNTWTAKDGTHRAGLKITVSRAMSVYEAGNVRLRSGQKARRGQQRTCARAVIHGYGGQT